MPSTTTATSAPATAGSSPSGSTRSGTSTPRRWRARRPARRGRPLTLWVPAYDPPRHDQPRWNYDYLYSGSTVHRSGARAAPGAGGHRADGTRFHRRNPRQRRRRAYRVKDLIPEGASVFTAASETLRLSGIDADINTSGRYHAVKPRVLAMDRVTGAADIRRLLASPDVV